MSIFPFLSAHCCLTQLIWIVTRQWLQVYPRCCFRLPQRPLHICCCHVWLTELPLCIQSNSTCSVRVNCGGSAKFHHQWIDHVEQSATCTVSTRAVTECLHMCTEDASVLDPPPLAPLRCFYEIPSPNTDALTYLLTCLCCCILLPFAFAVHFVSAVNICIYHNY